MTTGLVSEQAMSYFYLKLGKENSLLEYCLKNGPRVPRGIAFFGPKRWKDLYESPDRDPQFRAYVEVGAPERRDQTVIVVSAWGWMWFYQPAGVVEDGDPDPARFGTDDPPKYLPLRPAVRRDGWEFGHEPAISLAKVPAVLAGLRASRHLSSGTFRPISQPGNKAAIEWVLHGGILPATAVALERDGLTGLLRCLGSVELETLIAKLLEEAGLFVPAYRGGCVPDIDLFAHNDGDTPVNAGGITVKPHSACSIQVKAVSDRAHVKGSEDFRVCLAPANQELTFGVPWFAERLATAPKSRTWLRRSLHWLPPAIVDAHLPP